MSKSVLITIAAFGGLILISVILPKNSTEQSPSEQQEVTFTVPAYASDVFPIYPDGTIESVQESESEDKKSVSVRISVQTTKTEINAWYRQAFTSNEWSIKSDKNVAGYQIIQGENDNLYTSMQTANGSKEGEVMISQQLLIKKN